MCLGIPGRIKEISGDDAVIDFAGTTRSVSLKLMGPLLVGDYVIVHAGFAIEKVDEAAATETLRLIEETLS